MTYLAAVERERDAWKEDARRYAFNCEYAQRQVAEWRERAEKRLRVADRLRDELEEEYRLRVAYEQFYRQLLDGVTDALDLDPNSWDIEGGEEIAYGKIIARCRDLMATAQNVRSALGGD